MHRWESVWSATEFLREISSPQQWRRKVASAGDRGSLCSVFDFYTPSLSLDFFFFFLSGPSHTTALCQNLTSTSFHTGSCVMIISQQHRLRHSVRELKTHMNLCLLLLKGTPTTYSSSTSLFLFILHQWELLTFLLHSFLNNTRPNPLPSHGTLIRDNSQVNWTLYCLRLCSLRGENLHLMAMFTLEFLWTHCLTN